MLGGWLRYRWRIDRAWSSAVAVSALLLFEPAAWLASGLGTVRVRSLGANVRDLSGSHDPADSDVQTLSTKHSRATSRVSMPSGFVGKHPLRQEPGDSTVGIDTLRHEPKGAR